VPGSQDFSRRAGELFGEAVRFTFEDMAAQKLHYHLERLTSVGLTDNDVKDLDELASRVLLEIDVTEQVRRIKQRADVSPLAFAIADLLDHPGGSASTGPETLKTMILGAVLGAYTSFSDFPEIDQTAAAIVGAIGGAVAMSTSSSIIADMNRRSWDDYVRVPDEVQSP
jgi:hypothetical protein